MGLTLVYFPKLLYSPEFYAASVLKDILKVVKAFSLVGVRVAPLELNSVGLGNNFGESTLSSMLLIREI